LELWYVYQRGSARSIVVSPLAIVYGKFCLITRNRQNNLTAYCDHTFPRRHDFDNYSWGRVRIQKPRSRFDIWSKSLLPKLLQIEPRYSRLLVIKLIKKLCIWPDSRAIIVQSCDKPGTKFSFSIYNYFVVHCFVCMVLHYGPDDMKSMRLRRTIYRLQKKLCLLVKKAGFLRLIHRNAPCDYRELGQIDFSFVQVSSLSIIFYYRTTLVLGNRFPPHAIILPWRFESHALTTRPSCSRPNLLLQHGTEQNRIVQYSTI
jgi:hypothetical protein